MTRTHLIALAEGVREFPIALAHLMANTPLSDQERQRKLAGYYGLLNTAGRIKCLAELQECRAARRGERPATICH